LLELWNHRRGVWLKRQAYRDLGGVQQAVARTADAFVGRLTDADDRRRAADLFLRLVRVADEADAANETRRRVAVDELHTGLAS